MDDSNHAPKRTRIAAWSAIGALALAACAQLGVESDTSQQASGDQGHGARLFATHCAVCHGTGGAGDGPGYGWLFPRARDFTSGTFRLVSTNNGVPSDADLVHTLERGVPGSAMPAWGWMPESDLRDLARYVRTLAVEGYAQRLRDDAYFEGSTMSVRTAHLDAVEALRPGETLAPVEGVTGSADQVERGERLFAQFCASCHAEGGMGKPTPVLDEDGTLNWARDFTAGYLKGGAAPNDLANRIRAGLPGTAMPATHLSPEDLAALVAYVRHLIPEGAEQRFVHTRKVLVARRQTQPVPRTADDEAWALGTEVPIVLAPLAWRELAVHEARLTALHDGEHIAIRLSWDDATGDTSVTAALGDTDGVALQLSADDAPPLFGMGSRQHPTNIWHWRAKDFHDTAGTLDLLGLAPHAMGEPFRSVGRPDVPLYVRQGGQPRAGADSLLASGTGQTQQTGEARRVVARPSWHEGVWSVVFQRALTPSDDDEVALSPGGEAQFAAAVWNGDAGDRGGHKSISIWHQIELEP